MTTPTVFQVCSEHGAGYRVPVFLPPLGGTRGTRPASAPGKRAGVFLVLYSKPHADMTSKASVSLETVAHRNSTASGCVLGGILQISPTVALGYWFSIWRLSVSAKS